MANEETCPTLEEALTNASRLLHDAELETDLLKMERIEKLADSWIGIAGIHVATASRG
jgi:hypothetical protein